MKRVNVYAVASRAALVFGLPLCTTKGAMYPDDPKMRCQGGTNPDGSFRWARESDGKSVACLSLNGDACGWRLDFHRRGESGVYLHPLGSRSMTARELSDALYVAENALAFATRKEKP